MKRPLHEIKLQERALIEASAGTGKTWTLTGMLLRLLLEEQDERLHQAYAPNEIIVTTFTRKAAAELRYRVKMRLEDFYDLLKAILRQYETAPDLLEPTQIAEKINALLIKWQEDEDGHPVNQRLRHLSRDTFNQSILQKTLKYSGLDGFIRLLQRVENAINEVNDIFIGTLDSLCQKWLYEYRLETNTNLSVELIDDIEIIQSYIHDQLRIMLNDPSLSAEKLAEFLPNIDDAEKIARNIAMKLALSHGKIDEIVHFNGSDYQQLLKECQSSVITEEIANLEKNKDLYFSAHKGIQSLKDLGLDRVWQWMINEQRDYQNYAETWLKIINKGTFLKKSAKESLDFADLASSKALLKLLTMRQLRDETALREVAEIYQQLYLSTVAELPRLLEKKGKTSFWLQMKQLNQALEGQAGKNLALDIASRYPVMLVDESQDLNDSQAQLIRRIYLETTHSNYFLLLVGDPKQAIYRFRGGDVYNYQALKQYFDPKTQQYDLLSNFRSSESLIAALNAFYATDDNLGPEINYKPIEAGKKGSRNIVCHDQQAISQALHFVEYDKADDAYDRIIETIQSLKSAQSLYAKQQADGRLEQLAYQDILVLINSGEKLKELQKKLNAQGIPSQYSASISIFSGEVANSLTYLFHLMLNPNRGLLQGFLCSCFFDFSLADIHRLQAIENGEIKAETDDLTFDALMQLIEQSAKLWQKGRLLAAIQHFLSARLSGQSIWQRLASASKTVNERYLLDLRQFQQIIAEKKGFKRPETFWYWWRQMMNDQPKSDWAIPTALPTNDAVRLMTVHSAKGLQSPVVLYVNSQRGHNNKPMFAMYHDDDHAVHLYLENVASETARKLHGQEELEESKRLYYVAVTRAEDLLFVFHAQKCSYRDVALSNRTKAQLASTDLQMFIAADTEISTVLNQAVIKLPQSVKNELSAVETRPTKYREAFVGWRKTSFSALSRQQLAEETSAVLADFLFDDERIRDEVEIANHFPFTFAKGTQAGSFLHHVLEKIDFSDSQLWRKRTEQLLKRYHFLAINERLDEEDWQQYQRWFDVIVRSPLTTGSCLADVNRQQQCREMGFSLLANKRQELSITALNTLFERWGKSSIAFDKLPYLYGFIRGEIDFCYCHENQYHLIDYKSNYLGGQFSDYSVEKMNEAMDEHHYWLQALIYQTALHRYLSSHLKGYTMEQHLGHAEYFFLRGAQADAETGHLQVKIPHDIVRDFNALLLGEQR